MDSFIPGVCVCVYMCHLWASSYITQFYIISFNSYNNRLKWVFLTGVIVNVTINKPWYLPIRKDTRQSTGSPCLCQGFVARGKPDGVGGTRGGASVAGKVEGALGFYLQICLGSTWLFKQAAQAVTSAMAEHSSWWSLPILQRTKISLCKAEEPFRGQPPRKWQARIGSHFPSLRFQSSRS